MVTTVTSQIKIDNSGLKEVLKAIKYTEKYSAKCGVINADSKVVEIARLNHEGGESVYSYGPYKGDYVVVPPRPFVRGPVDVLEDNIKKVGGEAILSSNEFTERSLRGAIEAMAETTTDAQSMALETNGEGIGWQTWQDYRTIITKGHDKPLHTRSGDTFPIDYEIGKRSSE